MIVPYRDGPYLVRGPVSLRDQDDRRIGLGRRTIALCRCGKSRTRPFCDGTHRLVGFHAPSEAERPRSGSPEIGTRERMDSPSSNGIHEPRDRGLEPRADPIRRSYEVAYAKLLRAGAKTDSLLVAPVDATAHAAIRAAQSFIAAARLLLAEWVTHPEMHDSTPCLCLIREALDALGSVSTPECTVGELAALLTEVAAGLERSDSWR